MIIDLQRFLAEERKSWAELESFLDKLENRPEHRLSLDEVKNFHYLYQRTSADLAKLVTFASEPELRRYLESLVARAYGEIHETREKPYRLAPWRWFFNTFPRTFRRRVLAFWLSSAITLVGCTFGAMAIGLDPEAKEIIMPFPHLKGEPSERVAREESAKRDRLEGGKATFSAFLMTHNTRVSIFTMALGVTWGLGTVILLFYNGVILGAVASDYVMAGEAKFLLGWLLPHGVIEIPAILLAGQAGLLLGGALIGWGDRISLKIRLRRVSPDLVTIIFGMAIMLVWAGFIEAFLSQYHEPAIPYSFKIGFGVIEMILLALFLGVSGAKAQAREDSSNGSWENRYAPH